MRLRMVTLMAGPDGVHLPGSIVEVEDEAAAHIVAGGYALPVDIPMVLPSAAVAHGQERAVNPAPVAAERRKRGK